MEMNKEQWNNGKKGMEKITDYAKKNRTVKRNIGTVKTTEKFQRK
jgi:hypothetical protein